MNVSIRSAAAPLAILAITWVLYKLVLSLTNLYFSKLSKFPGPKLAAVTSYWKAFIEVIQQKSFCHKLEDVHAQYGEVVRVGPNELHFSNPQAYHDIYNNNNRWDKEYHLYHSFNEDRSSFGFLTYKEAKERKDALNKLFSQKAVYQTQGLVLSKINDLCSIYADLSKSGKVIDMTWSLRCLTMDIITYLCFGKSVDAMKEPDFKAPIIVAMDASMPVFTAFKHFDWYKNMIVNCPPNISKVVSPQTAGLVDLQQLLNKQISELSAHPEGLAHLPHNMTIYHQLMNKEAYRSGTVPSAGSLYEEAQAFMFAGADTTGATLMIATFHLLRNSSYYSRLKQELKEVWPKLSEPPELRELERLPYMNAILKESLRLTSGVVSGLLRVVPQGGARIADVDVPEGTVVSCGSTFVHYNSDIFPDPEEFNPNRWLDDPGLEQWLVPFSRGPRSCLGINFAWQEIRMILAHLYRRFDFELDPATPSKMEFRDTFLPFYYSGHVMAKATQVAS